MVRLTSISKNNNVIKCNIVPEDSKKKGALEVDIKTNEIVSYTLPTGYEDCISYGHHAKRRLIQILKGEKPMRDEYLVMWY